MVVNIIEKKELTLHNYVCVYGERERLREIDREREGGGLKQ